MQLFAHLLSSYLQGMGDFFSALTGQARRWVVADIREPALGNIRNHTQTHRAKP